MNFLQNTRNKIRSLVFGLAAITIVGSLSVGAAQAANDTTAAATATPALIITAAMVSGCKADGASTCTEDAANEYVEVFNPSTSALTVSGWKLRYLSSSGSTITDLNTIDGSFAPHSYTLFAHAGYYTPTTSFTFGAAGDSGKLAKSGGHVEIIDSSSKTVDRLGWGRVVPKKPSSSR